MELLDLLLQSAQLKWVTRSGWQMRGVSDPESVAEHAWGVAWLALLLADLVEEPLDRHKLLALALFHDLPEVVLSDIPAPALHYLGAGAKQEAEERILAEMLAPVPSGERWLAWWREYEAFDSPEGRLVRDADRLELLIQAYLYEKARSIRLDEFWDDPSAQFSFAAAQRIYEALCTRRLAQLGA